MEEEHALMWDVSLCVNMVMTLGVPSVHIE